MSAQYTTTAPTFIRDEAELRDSDFEIESDAAGFAPTPVYARTNKKKAAGPSKAILFAVPAALLAAGAAAYFTMQLPSNDLVAETPVVAAPAAPMMAPPAAETAAVTPAVPQTVAAAEPAPLPVNPTPAERVSASIPAAAPAAPRRAQPARIARARPAAAPSAEAASEDASAMLPGAPIPYAATTPQGAAVAPLTPAPQAAAPAAPEVAPTAPPAMTTRVNPDPMAPGASAIP